MKNEDVARELVRIAKKLMEEKEAGLGRMSGEKKAGAITTGSYHNGELSQREATAWVAGDITKGAITAYAIIRWDRRPGP